MAQRSTFLYAVVMGYGDNTQQVAYCYARNRDAAVSGMKKLFEDQKYDNFQTKMFGETDIRLHPGPFEPMTREEVEYISEHGIANMDAYSQRKNGLPGKGVFISADKLNEVLEGV